MAVRQMNIDLDRITQEIFSYTRKEFPIATQGLANLLLDQAMQFWRATAQSSSAWGERYASTLKLEPFKTGMGRVFVDEEHPNAMFVYMMEDGVKTWSIKKALLEGKAARRNLAKYGKLFVRVPFRFRTPGKGKKTSGFAGVMPSDIYALVKGGKRLSKAPDNMPHIAGLKKYGSGVHSQYLTFRTVTETSAGWQYPNVPATPVFQKVQKRVEAMIGQTIVNMVKGFEKDLKGKFK